MEKDNKPDAENCDDMKSAPQASFISVGADRVGDPEAEINTEASAAAKLSELLKRLDDLKSLFEAKLAYDATREELIRRQATELQQFRDNIVEAQKKPILLDLLSYWDSLSSVVKEVSREGGVEKVSLLERLKILQDELLEILSRQDVRRFDERLTKLDRRRHRAIRVVDAASEDQDNEVVRVVRDGFTWAERILRTEEVVVKKWKSRNARGA